MRVRNILFSIAVTAVLAAAGAADAGAQQKRALVIGIGDYPAGSGWREINGDRDELYIHFSGHGQQVTDVSGDEPDGLDEALIPYDAAIEYGRNGYKGQNHILDDELGVWLEALRESVGPKGVIVVALDACHSGDAGSLSVPKGLLSWLWMRATAEMPRAGRKMSRSMCMERRRYSGCRERPGPTEGTSQLRQTGGRRGRLIIGHHLSCLTDSRIIDRALPLCISDSGLSGS